MTTVAVYLPQLSTVTGLTLLLTQSTDFAVLNGAGDALTESGTSGWFTADVAEAWTVSLGAAVVDAGGLVPFSGRLGVGATIVADGLAELDSTTQAQLTAIEDGVDANTGYLTGLVAKFTGITIIADWLRRAFRKDAGTAGMIAAEAEINTGGTSTFTGITDNLEAIKDASGSPLTGPHTITITVTDGTDPLEGARVSMTKGADTESKLTSVAGVAVFTVETGTWTRRVKLTGYSGVTADIVVTATAAATVALTPIGITPSVDPATTTGYQTMFDAAQVEEPGAILTVQLLRGPTGTGAGYDTGVRYLTADMNGLVQVPGMVKGGVYLIYRGKKTLTEYLVPSDAAATWAITSVAGTDLL